MTSGIGHPHPKVLVIGLDAGDWIVVNQLLKNESLPNIAGVLKDGVRADMISTIPDMTPPAWTTMVTGVNPGRHNVFGFSQPSGHTVRLTNGANRRAPAVWELLDHECTKLIVNVPMSYPARPLNGCTIADSLTLVKEGDWAWPKEEKRRLLEQGYAHCLLSHIAEVKDLSQLVTSTKIRGKVFLDLMTRYPSCFSMIVFSETDWVQHIFPENIEATSEVYREIDRFVGEILPKLEKESVLMLVSDHGFRIAKRKFFVNNWLAQHDLLKIESRQESPFGRIVSTIAGRVGPLLPTILRVTPRRLRERIAPGVFSPVEHLASIRGVYHAGWDLGQYLRLYITEGERGSYEEIHQRLVALSQTLKDESTGRRTILRVLRKGEIYSGPFVISAPDFILDLDPQYSGNERVFKSESVFLDYTVGVHRKEGLFIAKWHDSDSNLFDEHIGEIDICDVAPTIARIFGKTISSDGRIIQSLLTRVHS